MCGCSFLSLPGRPLETCLHSFYTCSYNHYTSGSVNNKFNAGSNSEPCLFCVYQDVNNENITEENYAGKILNIISTYAKEACLHLQ